MSYPVFCHHCPQPHFIGETTEPTRFAGLFKVARDRMELPSPRAAHRCDKCGWWTITEPTRDSASWREIRLKRQA